VNVDGSGDGVYQQMV